MHRTLSLIIVLIVLEHADYALSENKEESHRIRQIDKVHSYLENLNKENETLKIDSQSFFDKKTMLTIHKISNPLVRRQRLLKVLPKQFSKDIKAKLLDRKTFIKTYAALSLTRGMRIVRDDFFKQPNTLQTIRNILQPALPLDQDSIKIFLKGIRSSTLNAQLRKQNPHLPETFNYGVKVYEQVTTIQKEFNSLDFEDCTFDLTPLEDAIHTQSNFDLTHNQEQKIIHRYSNHTVTFISRVSSDMRYLGAMLNHINNTLPESIGKIYKAESELCSQEYYTTTNDVFFDQIAANSAYQYHISNEMIMNDGRFLSDFITHGSTPGYKTNIGNNQEGWFCANHLFIDVRPLEQECLRSSTGVAKLQRPS